MNAAALLRSPAIPAFLLTALLTSSCQRPPRQHVLTGEAMGTTYRIKVVSRAYPDQAKVAIDGLLAELDGALSTWREDSWISAFNRLRSAEPVVVPPRIWPLLVEASQLAEETEGRFDPTIGSLVRLWGFGPHRQARPVAPSVEEIRRALEHSGHRKLILFPATKRVAKRTPHLALDCSAIAKGFTADLLAGELERRGYASFLIEFGGDIVARGVSPGRAGWRVSTPTSPRPIILRNGAVATSGSDHQQRNGLSHLIDPRSGHPIAPGPPVTVQASSGARADALATAEAIRRAEAGGM